jgi:LuxR family transcriptional regulator
MTDTHLPGIENELAMLNELGTSGFVLALNIRWVGPAYVHFEYPSEWREIYECKNSFARDPVVSGSLSHEGFKRGSALKLPDPAGIFKQGRAYDLNYGAVLATRSKRHRSFLTAARQDREFTDSELKQLSDILKSCVKVASEASDTA